MLFKIRAQTGTRMQPVRARAGIMRYFIKFNLNHEVK